MRGEKAEQVRRCSVFAASPHCSSAAYEATLEAPAMHLAGLDYGLTDRSLCDALSAV